MLLKIMLFFCLLINPIVLFTMSVDFNSYGQDSILPTIDYRSLDSILRNQTADKTTTLSIANILSMDKRIREDSVLKSKKLAIEARLPKPPSKEELKLRKEIDVLEKEKQRLENRYREEGLRFSGFFKDALIHADPSFLHSFYSSELIRYGKDEKGVRWIIRGENLFSLPESERKKALRTITNAFIIAIDRLSRIKGQEHNNEVGIYSIKSNDRNVLDYIARRYGQSRKLQFQSLAVYEQSHGLLLSYDNSTFFEADYLELSSRVGKIDLDIRIMYQQIDQLKGKLR